MKRIHFLPSKERVFVHIGGGGAPLERHGLGSGWFSRRSMCWNYLARKGSVRPTLRSPGCEDGCRRLRPCPDARVSLSCPPPWTSRCVQQKPDGWACAVATVWLGNPKGCLESPGDAVSVQREKWKVLQQTGGLTELHGELLQPSAAEAACPSRTGLCLPLLWLPP